jgi:hypothetical protein
MPRKESSKHKGKTKKRYPRTAREIEEAIQCLPENEIDKWGDLMIRRTFEWFTRLSESQVSELLRFRAEHNNTVSFETGIDPWQACVDWYFRWKHSHRKKDSERIASVHELHNKTLPDGKKLTKGQIAKKLGIDVRQVRRDINCVPDHEGTVIPIDNCPPTGQKQLP